MINDHETGPSIRGLRTCNEESRTYVKKNLQNRIFCASSTLNDEGTILVTHLSFYTNLQNTLSDMR